jgi:hypothetical protein
VDSFNDISQFVGRLHVVLSHLPIGILVLLGALELISATSSGREALAANRFILMLAAPAAVCTAVCGWVLAGDGGYDGELLFLHRWTGVGVAVSACLLWWFERVESRRAYRIVLVLAVVLTILAGHFGGSMTHGKDYLTPFGPFRSGGGQEHQGAGAAGAVGFASVEPILADYCVACHGPDKSKGGLRMDSLSQLLAGGDSGPVVVFGDPGASLLLQRVVLPLSDDDHMPPEGKPQPSAADLQGLRDWVTGAEVGTR